MSFTHQKAKSVTAKSGLLTESLRTYTASQVIEIKDEAIPDGSTDLLVAMAFDVSQVKSFVVLSTQDVTLETNDGATPAETINLKANKMYEWDTDSYDTFLLTTDVTAFYLTNSSGSEATFSCLVLIDPTV